MLNIIIAILVFSFLIIIHELGHFAAAKLFGVGVKEFSVGMGPKLFSVKSEKSGTAYSLRLILFGGYVSMVGEDDEDSSENSFNVKPAWQRLIITLAGAIMNILAGVIITCIIVSSSPKGSTVIADFAEESTTKAAGLCEGDEILKIGNKKVHTYYDLNYTVFHDAISPVDVTVKRNNETVVINDVVFPLGTSSGVRYASMDFRIYAVKNSFSNVLKHSFYQSVTTVRMIWESLFDLITGRYGVEAVSGPVGTTKVIGEAAEEGTISLLSITSFIALNLGIFNLLPIPGLDGGRILLIIVEIIRRKPMKREVEGYINAIGLGLMLLLMVLITFKDVFALIRNG